MTDPSTATNRSERYEWKRIVRQPTGFGVAQMIVRHPTHGTAVVALSRDELRHLAMQALAAMEPDAVLDALHERMAAEIGSSGVQP